MKRSFYLMAVIIPLFFVWSTSSFAVDKIGFINLQEIMQNSNAGKKAAEDFKKFYEKETQEIKSSEKELKKMKDDLEKQSSIMTTELAERKGNYLPEEIA